MTMFLHWPDYLPAFTKAAEAQSFSSEILTQTPAGPLTVWHRPGAGPHVYLSAGMHGDEPAGPLALLQLLTEGHFPTHLDLRICPALNPTGLAAQSRENMHGIDLNRDYLKRQTEEVIAHTAWIERTPIPGLFLSLHEDCDVTGFYLYEINCTEDRPELASSILQAVTPWFPPEAGVLIDDHVPRAAGWLYHPPIPDIPDGWPEAIFLAKRGCPRSFTFETPCKALLDARVAAHCAAVRTALQAIF